MIAYNETWLANLRLHNLLEKDLATECITNEENVNIKQKYPVGFYTPNLFVRVGLFILTCIIVLFADALFGLMFSSAFRLDSFGIFFFVLAAVTYAALEFMVSSGNHFCSGVDDALLIIFFGQLITAFALTLFHDSITPDYLTMWLIAFASSALLTVRFTDMLMSAVCCVSFFAVVFYLWIKVGSIGLSTVPFILMVASGLIHRLVHNKQREGKLLIYSDCLSMAQVICLVTLYAAGNYYMIQRLGTLFMGTTGPVAFGWFFWAWSILIPFIYLGFGIRDKDVILLRLGLILVVPAVFTFRYYYHILPTDVALSLAGALVLTIVYAVAKYLKNPKHGFTQHETGDGNLMDKLKVESLIVAGTFSHTPTAPADSGTKFGGGDFGGGGSSGNF